MVICIIQVYFTEVNLKIRTFGLLGLTNSCVSMWEVIMTVRFLITKENIENCLSYEDQNIMKIS